MLLVNGGAFAVGGAGPILGMGMGMGPPVTGAAGMVPRFPLG